MLSGRGRSGSGRIACCVGLSVTAYLRIRGLLTVGAVYSMLMLISIYLLLAASSEFQGRLTETLLRCSMLKETKGRRHSQKTTSCAPRQYSFLEGHDLSLMGQSQS